MMLLFFSYKNKTPNVYLKPKINIKKKKKKLIVILYYYLRGCLYLDQIFFWFQNTPTPLGLSREKTKG